MNRENIYITWVVYAVSGKTQESDAVMREHGAAVREVAAELRARFPVIPKPLYRGLLLIDQHAKYGELAAEPGTQSTSFTEDRNCALWFACPEASIAGTAVPHYRSVYGAEVRGYVVKHTAKPTDVLFHHSWRRIPIETSDPRHAGLFDLRAGAMYAERMGALPETGACQFEWALQTQSEVILEPAPLLALHPVAIENVAALEAQYGPPKQVYAVMRHNMEMRR